MFQTCRMLQELEDYLDVFNISLARGWAEMEVCNCNIPNNVIIESVLHEYVRSIVILF